MQLLDPDVPPEFQDLMAQILTVLPTAPGTPSPARTRRGARLSKNNYTARRALLDIKEACELLATRLKMDPAAPATRTFVYNQTRAVLMGSFDPQYWEPQLRTSHKFITSEPTSVIDPSPGPYAYRDPANLPSIPTYPDGTETGASPRYTGATSAGLFKDTSLCWQRDVYELTAAQQDNHGEPTLLHLIGTVTATADARGDRGMLSLQLNREFGAPGDVPDFDGTPPFTDSLSFYWRFKTPTGAPPYYDYSQNWNIVARLDRGGPASGAGNQTSMALLTWPRCLMGREFNNNTAIQTDLDHTAHIYQIKDPTGKGQKLLLHRADNKFTTFDPVTGAEVTKTIADAFDLLTYGNTVFLGRDPSGHMAAFSKTGARIGPVTVSDQYPTVLGAEKALGARPGGWTFVRAHAAGFQPYYATTTPVTGDRGAYSPWPYWWSDSLADITICYSTKPNENVLVTAAGKLYFFSDAAAPIASWTPPHTISSWTLTKTGAWALLNNGDLYHVPFTTHTAALVRHLAHTNRGISQCLDGCYINDAGANIGILHPDNTLDALSFHQPSAQLMGRALDWTP